MATARLGKGIKMLVQTELQMLPRLYSELQKKGGNGETGICSFMPHLGEC